MYSKKERRKEEKEKIKEITVGKEEEQDEEWRVTRKIFTVTFILFLYLSFIFENKV